MFRLEDRGGTQELRIDEATLLRQFGVDPAEHAIGEARRHVDGSVVLLLLPRKKPAVPSRERKA